ncbi:MAG: DUF4276 family protein [Cyclobacteriaceae bacterium]
MQKHELEALMFSDMSGFELVTDDRYHLKQIKQIIDEYPNPEDINNSEETAPSRRLRKIFRYNKVLDGELVFEMVGIEKIMEKCPRFSQWMNNIEDMLRTRI